MPEGPRFSIVSDPKQPKSLFLRALLPADLPELSDLWVEAWTAAMPGIDFAARRAWLVDHLTGLAENGTAVIVGYDPANGAMAGFVTIDPATGRLDQIAVSLRHQGGTAASELLDAARAVSPEVLRLDVNADNPRARAFYARQGFVETGRGQNPTSGLATIALEWRK